MINQNMHIHSKYSWDSKMEISEIARILFKNKIKYAALTDHIEFDREDLQCVLNKFKRRNSEIDKINEIYEGELILLKAAEISEPHLYQNEVEALNELDLDFTMGSIHKIRKNELTELDKYDAAYRYYMEILEMIETSSVDVIGHLDYINRYYKKDYSFYYQTSRILNAIKNHNKIIEINTSGQRRCDLSLFPSIDKLTRYKLVQDEIIIGTDAHKYDELTDNLKIAEQVVTELNLKPVIYQKRKRIIL